MSALIKLGLSEIRPEHSNVSVDAQGWLERFETADGWLKKVFEGIEKLPENFKDAGEIGEILEKAAPWIEAGSKAFPPAHLLFEVVSALTKINDPRDLAILASTVAYQSIADKAIRAAGLPEGKSVVKRLRDSIGVTREEFAYFTIEGALTHPFIRSADEVLEFYAGQARYDDRQIERIINSVHERFREEFRLLIADGENKEKFAPLRNWLGIDAKEAFVREALRRHIQYTSWLYEEAPVLDEEPYALKHIYIDTGCGVLTRDQLQEKDRDGRPVRDPFKRDKDNGGVEPLLGQVLSYIRDPNFDDVIVIQGAAGAGKSSFTKHLSATLARDGLTPLLVRLRDAANISKGLLRTIGDALRYEDQVYLRGAPGRFEPPFEVLGNGTLFNEATKYHGTSICPYVLIVDGWDEISMDVAEGYKQKVQALLTEIRQEFFRGRHERVRVILTGRPSDAIDTSENFFNPNTPVITVRQMSPDQLIEFATKVRSGVNDRPLRRYTSSWKMPPEAKLKPLFNKYEQGFRDESIQISEQVLGVPFLAQLAFRVIANPGPDGDKVATDSTTLLRRITEITVHARYSSDLVRLGGKLHIVESGAGKKLHGDSLRRLLHKTASKMTIVGRESVSHSEWSDHLRASNEDELIEQAEQVGGITGLLIAFFFKGGNTHLGCEFTHKALREYLFAEAVVECIKEFAGQRQLSKKLPVRAHYWRDFGDDDPRKEWSRSLAELLAPQWPTESIRNHILNLLDWELARTAVPEFPKEATQPLTLEEWMFVRDGLADVYDWWAEGTPMRPQLVVVPKKKELEWSSPYFHTLIEEQFDLPSKNNVLSVAPPRLITHDAHLGAALMELTAAVHDGLRERISQMAIDDPLREGSRVQSKSREVLEFCPGSRHPEYFTWYCDRVNAAGWYRTTSVWLGNARFPSLVSLRGANLQSANLVGTNFIGTNFCNADLHGADLRGANFVSANLTNANLFGVDLRRADLTDTTLISASLGRANLTSAILGKARLAGADLSNADLTDTDLSGANLTGAILTNVDLSNTRLLGANLSGVDLTTVTLPAGVTISAEGLVQ